MQIVGEEIEFQQIFLTILMELLYNVIVNKQALCRIVDAIHKICMNNRNY